MPLAAVPEFAAGLVAVLDEVPAVGRACGVGRRFVADALRDWGVPDPVVEMSMLVTSEMVANAVTHAPPPGRLRLRAAGDRVLIEVSDAAVAEPRMVRPGGAVAGGRGLLLIDRLATRWGWVARPPGKIVWCEVSLPGPVDRL